jgi:hypothetical protein
MKLCSIGACAGASVVVVGAGGIHADSVGWPTAGKVAGAEFTGKLELGSKDVVLVSSSAIVSSGIGAS